RRLMQRIRVDFPEPDGPMTTTTSPLFTDSEMSLSTWNSPNHLLRPSISMMRSPGGASALTAWPVLAVLVVSVTVYLRRCSGMRTSSVGSSPLPYPKLLLELAARDRHPVREEEVDDGDEQEHLEFD